MTVRHATVADAAGIAAVHLAAWRAAYRDDAPAGWLAAQTVQERTDVWRARLAAVGDGSATHVAVTGDATIVGFCGVTLPSPDRDADEDTAEIATFYVHPDHWRAGAGRALMSAALSELGAGGYEAVTLWVLETNARAQAFYAAIGFAADGARLPQADWPPQLRMRRAV